MMMKFKGLGILVLVLMIGVVGASKFTFDINFNNSDQDVNGSLNISVNSPEDGEIVSKNISFEINVFSSDVDSLNCTWSVDNLTPLPTLSPPSYVTREEELESGIHYWTVECTDINTTQPVSASGEFVVENFSIEILDNFENFYYNNESISGKLSRFDEGAYIEICGNTCSQISVDSDGLFTISENYISNPGAYMITAYRTLNYDKSEISSYTVLFSVEEAETNEDDGTDKEDPELTLVYPTWDDEIFESVIDFEYEISDNVDIDFCDFRIYNATSESFTDDDYLVYEETKDDFSSKSKTVKVKIIDFDERDYHWEVYCEDSEGNSVEDFNYFTVDLDAQKIYSGSSDNSNHSRASEIKELREKIDDFLTDYDNLGLAEKRAVEILGIKEDMMFYDTKLNQIDLDFQDGFRAMTEAKKQDAISRNDQWIEDIRNDLVVSVSVGQTYEYTKNSPDIEMLDFVSRYFEAKDENIKSGTMKLIAKANERFFGAISVKAEVLKINIEYMDETKEMVLVNKEVGVDDEVDGAVFEITDGVEDVTFLSEATEVGDSIWEVDLGSDSYVTYYFFDDISLQKIEKTENLVFDEEAGENANMITGFAVAIGNGSSFGVLGFLIGFLFLGYAGFWFLEKFD